MRTTKYLFSVVIPVYNVQAYLEACIESVLQQSCKDYEVLLIDDGSTDGSEKICDQYAEKEPKIRTIHQKNGGLSCARNVGLQAACGDYVVFLDSDDMLIPVALERFHQEIRKQAAEIYAGYPVCLYMDGATAMRFPKRKLPRESMCGREFMECGLSQGSWEAPVQFNIYKRCFLIQNGLWFQQGILHEDELWTPQVFLKAETVREVACNFYIYRIRPGSITTSDQWKMKKALDALYICRELERIADLYERRQVRWLRDHLAMLYMNAVFAGRLKCIENRVKLDRLFPLRNAASWWNRMKAALFAGSPTGYCTVNSIWKTVRKVKAVKRGTASVL